MTTPRVVIPDTPAGIVFTHVYRAMSDGAIAGTGPTNGDGRSDPFTPWYDIADVVPEQFQPATIIDGELSLVTGDTELPATLALGYTPGTIPVDISNAAHHLIVSPVHGTDSFSAADDYTEAVLSLSVGQAPPTTLVLFVQFLKTSGEANGRVTIGFRATAHQAAPLASITFYADDVTTGGVLSLVPDGAGNYSGHWNGQEVVQCHYADADPQGWDTIVVAAQTSDLNVDRRYGIRSFIVSDAGVFPTTMSAPGTGGGGGGGAHSDTTGRSNPDQHPIGAITGLATALAPLRSTPAPTLTQGPGAGEAPGSVELDANSTDSAGKITAIPGALAESSAILCTVENEGTAWPNGCAVVLSPTSFAAQASGVIAVADGDGSQFTLLTGAGLTEGLTYSWDYVVIGLGAIAV